MVAFFGGGGDGGLCLGLLVLHRVSMLSQVDLKLLVFLFQLLTDKMRGIHHHALFGLSV